MIYVMLSNLPIIFFFDSLIEKSFKKVFISCFAMSYIIVYSTTIIPNTLNKVTNQIEFRVVEGWSI